MIRTLFAAALFVVLSAAAGGLFYLGLAALVCGLIRLVVWW